MAEVRPASASPGTATRFSTRVILTCAAIGAVSAVLFAGYTWVEAAVIAALPMLIVFTAGLWFLVPLLATLLLRRGGVALITSAIAGLLAGIVSPYGWTLPAFAVVYALIVEIPFLLTRWRRFGRGIVAVTAAVFWAGSVAAYWAAFDLDAWGPVVVAAVIAALLVCYLAWAYLAYWLAARLRPLTRP